jgi:hypothetical protein
MLESRPPRREPTGRKGKSRLTAPKPAISIAPSINNAIMFLPLAPVPAGAVFDT